MTCEAYADWPPGSELCMRYCDTQDDCASLGIGAICYPGGDFNFCTIPCDLTDVDLSGCPDNTQCSVVSGRGMVVGTSCTGAGSLGKDDRCSPSSDDCGPGLACDSASSVCRLLCIEGRLDSCPTTTGCSLQALWLAGSKSRIGLCE